MSLLFLSLCLLSCTPVHTCRKKKRRVKCIANVKALMWPTDSSPTRYESEACRCLQGLVGDFDLTAQLFHHVISPASVIRRRVGNPRVNQEKKVNKKNKKKVV